MNFTIPVYVEVRENAYHTRPLFFPDVESKAGTQGRAMARLAGRIRGELDLLGAQDRHDALAACTFHPEISTVTARISVEADGRHFRATLLAVAFEALARRIALLPGVPGLWFELPRGEAIEGRVQEMVAAHLRRKVRNGETVELPSERAWLTTLELSHAPPLAYAPAKPSSLLAFLGGDDELDGASELSRTGRCLDDLHPDGLERAVLREREAARLVRILELPDLRPVLVRGQRRVGKTALIHEAVFRRVEKRGQKGRGETWLVSPQRLISGMQYVGMWEARLVAILEAARKKELILYFDDLPGLFSAGKSASSELPVAGVLKPFLERREVRILAEITPEAFRVLQELDRGFCDLFEIVSLEETSPNDTLRIVLDGVRRAELRQKTRFTPESIGLIVDLQRRHVCDAVFPGKACVFAQQLAARCRGGVITREVVLDEFHDASGLSLQFLDGRRRLPRDEVVAALRERLTGQEEAIQAMADVAAVAKARLAEPSRPLASMLFLGPTGVGKTQAARALAAFLLGDESRMLRFDMNEFVAPDAVARLVGTFASPSGLLTSAVRQMPFCVLLLDEIEKANPDVFNLLLQMLGDGRLTDARGRTVDFTQAIVVMTSNLGVSEAARPVGFRTDRGDDSLVYRRAAESFFSPELFNRLDRIVPFARLTRDEVTCIARRLVNDVLAREGLLRRQCILDIDPRVFASVVDEGFDPLLGARALRRAVERRVAEPVACRLAATAPSGPMILSLSPGDDGPTAAAHRLQCAGTGSAGGPEAGHFSVYGQARGGAFLPGRGEPLEAVLTFAEQVLNRLDKEAGALAPRGPVEAGSLGAEALRYFRLRDGIAFARTLRERAASPGAPPRRPPRRQKAMGPRRRLLPVAEASALGDVLLERDLRSAVQRIAASAGPIESAAGQVDRRVLAAALLRDIALLAAIAAADVEEEALLRIRGLSHEQSLFPGALAGAYAQAAEEWLGLDVESVASSEGERALRVRGAAAWRLMRAEHGIHLALEGERLVPVSLVVEKCSGAPPGARRPVWDDERAEVIRIYDVAHVIDLRSGAVAEGAVDGAAMRELILAGAAFANDGGEGAEVEPDLGGTV